MDAAKTAEMTLTLKCGRSYVVRGDATKLRKLKIALARRMHLGERATEDVHGEAYVGGVAHPVDVTVTTDQLAGVQLVFPALAGAREKRDGRRSDSRDAAE